MVSGRQAERPREAQAAAAGVVHQAVSFHRVACPAVLAGGAEAGVGGLALLAREGPAAAVADTRVVSARSPDSPPPALPSMGGPLLGSGPLKGLREVLGPERESLPDVTRVPSASELSALKWLLLHQGDFMSMKTVIMLIGAESLAGPSISFRSHGGVCLHPRATEKGPHGPDPAVLRGREWCSVKPFVSGTCLLFLASFSVTSVRYLGNKRVHRFFFFQHEYDSKQGKECRRHVAGLPVLPPMWNSLSGV